MRTDLYWIDGPWPGRLAIMPRPRGGDWLEDEVAAWKDAGVDVVVSLLTGEESRDLELIREGELCAASQIDWISFPVADRSVPSSRQAFIDLLRSLEALLGDGKNVAIHCRQGIGRAALMAAGLFVIAGQDAELAFQRISAARGCPTPDTPEQRRWVAELAQTLATPL